MVTPVLSVAGLRQRYSHRWSLDIPALEPLVELCRELDRSDFLVTMAPLRIRGGTGSPVNPIAIF